MSKVLVTGGAGFLGSHLVEKLVRAGREVLVVDDLSLGRRDNLAGLPGVELIEASVLDVDAWAARAEGVTTLYHLAAQISGYDSLREPERYLEANVHGLVRVLDVFRERPGLRVVFASSATVYGASARPPSAEGDLPAPVTPYALSKLAGEHLLAMYAPLRGFDYAALRLFNVYGPRQSPDHPYANVTCKLAKAAATGGSFQLFGDGAQTRDFIYVDDVIDALLLAGEGEAQGIFNVGTGSEASVLELIETVGRLSGAPVDVRQGPAWPNDVRRVRADITRLSALGWAPRVGLEEGLGRSIAYFRGAP